MEELTNKIILKKYRIIKRIGKGSFGSVFLGKNIQQNDFVAIKLESKNQTDTILERETYILYSLKGFGIPEVITYGQNIKYNILIQELLGKSIDKIFFEKNRKFSMKDCCMIGIQILDRLEYIHSKYIIHRDIKADNFLTGLKNKGIIYIIDFGLAKQYKSRKTGKHVKFVINKKWSGTSRFASANTLRGVEPSRRDDLESFCYLLLYLMKGSLPWDHINEESEINEILIIYKMKQYMTPEMLFIDLPLQMAKFYKYCKSLEFEQKPNYKYLRSLLISILKNIGEQNDLHFCWIINTTLNKCKSGFINNKSKEKDNKKEIIKTMNNSKSNQNKINNRKNIINLEYSTGKINKKEKLKNEIKNNILGHCNIIKRKYIKSQSPEIKRVVTEEDKNKKKLINKKSIVIDLTNFIETKKANEIKSYRTKLFNYKANERHIKFINHSDKFNLNFNYINNDHYEHNEERNLLTERNLIKSPKNLFLKKIIKNTNSNNINESSLYSINNINNTSYIKSTNTNNGDKIKSKINGYYFKEKIISPVINCKMKRININKKLSIYEEAKNGYLLSSKKRKFSSNSFGKNIKKNIKTVKKLKDIEIIDNNKNIHNNSNNNVFLKKDLTILIPRRQKTTYTIDNFRNYKSFINSSINDIYRNKLNLIYINHKRSMALSPEIIKRKKTDTSIRNFSFNTKYLLGNNNNSNIRKIILNKKKIKKEKNSEDKNTNYINKNNYIKDQIYSSYNKYQLPKKKYSYNFKNLNLMNNFRINKIY